MNRKLLAAAVAGVIAPMAAQAVDLSVSGHVNRMIRFADNGAGSDVQHLDHTASRSAFRFEAEGELMDGVSAGAHIESGFASNRGFANDVDTADSGPGNDDFRFSYIYFSGAFGKVTLGHTAIAGDGLMYQSHNGAWMGTEFGVDSNSGISVMASDGTPAGTVGAYFTNGALGPGRANILRYDTPSIGPITVQASVRKDGASDHIWNFGGTLSSDFGGANMIGGLVFSEDALGLAGGVAFAQGTSVNLAWGQDDNGNRDYEVVYANVAHAWGDTSVALQYQTASDAAGMDGQNIGLGVNQSLGSGVDVYAGFNNYTFDDATARDLEDVNSFHIGSRVRFN
jgi:predicted porin